MPSRIFDVCEPRPDVLAGAITESDFAADLAQVIRGTAPDEYRMPARFFENTYPTRGLRNLLANVCRRVSGAGGEAASIFRLDTQFGGGKTHGLIALVHAARGLDGVRNVEEFIDPTLLPKGTVRVAAFDGENADPLNGRTMGDGIRAYTPWGEIAYSLAGAPGYERVRASDEQRVAPGADTLRELFGGEPTLILLDELSVYLRKVKGLPGARDQLSAFLTSLFKAVEGTPNVALVYTLAIGKDSRASDAYGDENEFIAERMAEAESISARKATLLNPTEDDETAHVLRRRLFASIDETRVPAVIDAYRALWKQHESALSPEAVRPETIEAFRASYPLHPDVLDTLTEKAATLSNFQRVRGMLRLLARTVGHVWKELPDDAYAIHLHHIDLAHEPIRQELVTRLGLAQYVPALKSDVAGSGNKSLAQVIDDEHYRGMPPYATYAARAIFVHTLAFNDQLRGVSPEHLRFSMIGPGIDVSFADDARKRFVAESAFLDDRPGAPLRFLAEANLTQIIRRQEQHVDPEEVRAQLRDKIKQIFSGTSNSVFNLVPFPGGAYEVPDEIGDGRPLLVVLGYDAVSIGGVVEAVPHLVDRIFKHKGADDKALRGNRNALVLVVADDARKDEMRHRMVRRLALHELKKAERIGELAEHQQAKVRELESRSETDVALAIQQCYRHVFYPSRADRVSSDTDLGHTAIDVPSTSATPGVGQRQVERALRELKKLRTTEDEPDSPTFIRDRTPLKKGEITTRALREEFRRGPGLPMLVRDDVFVRGVQRGIEQGEYVYRSGELLYGPGDPGASIAIDDQSFVYTMGFAKERGIWPRPAPRPEPSTQPTLGGSTVPPGPGGGSGAGGPAAGAGVTPPPASAASQLFAEGVLKEALAQLWEKVRARKIDRIQALRIRMFEASDAFKLLGVVGSVQGARKMVKLEGEYETADRAAFRFQFDGPSTDAQAVKEFLEPQLRAASEKTLNAEFELRLDNGLTMSGDAPERLAERLTRYAAGSAYVTASADTASTSSAGAAA
ncbi:MAG TPA: DUF499 domain-containing protein [Gemmatimonadaceae bacterium]|nr:DUF499 domain-containing protein [Gemmatimonadaceae bacterium]